MAQYTPIPTLQAPHAGYEFAARQTLTFDVDWRVFTAGTAVFHLEQQGTTEKVTATADTIGADAIIDTAMVMAGARRWALVSDMA